MAAGSYQRPCQMWKREAMNDSLLRPQHLREPVKIEAAEILKAPPVGRNVGAKEIARERAHEPGDQIFHRANGRAARAEAQRRGEIEAVDVAQRPGSARHPLDIREG